MLYCRPKYPLHPDIGDQTNIGIGSYLTLGMLTGQEYWPADLIRILSQWRRSDLIRWLTAVSSWITAEDGMNIRQQMQMAEKILPDELQCRAAAFINKEGDKFCLFHRRQILFTLQFVLLVCKDDTSEQDDEAFTKIIGECLLMASHVLARVENEHKPDVGETTDDANRWIVTVFASLLAVRDGAEILARAESFWFDIPATKIISDHLDSMGIPPLADIFKAKYGVDLREFMMLIVVLHEHFKQHAATNSSPLRFEVQGLVPVFNQETVEGVLAIIASDPDALAFKLLSEPRQNWASDLQALRERPMLRISPAYAVCHDFGLLNRCLTEGIYYLLDRAYGRKKFKQLFGYIFEEYVNGLIRQFAIESSLLARNFYASPKYESKNDQAGDGILYWDETAILMEYKSRLLTTRERYAGIPEALIDGVDDILGKEGKEDSKKGIVQLACNLKPLLAGEKVVAQSKQPLVLSQCKTIFPMIVVYEDTVAIEAVRQHAQQRFQEALKKRGVDSSKVGPLMIFSLADIEILEVLAKKVEAKRLLADYADHFQRNPKARLSTFQKFAHKRYKSEITGLEWWVGQTHMRAWKNVMEEVERRDSSRPPEHRGEGEATGKV